MLNPKKMPEAEVSLRLAFFLLEQGLASSSIDVGIDQAQVRTKAGEIFPIEIFLEHCGWTLAQEGADTWRGTYSHRDFDHRLRLHSKPGVGDVACQLHKGGRLRAECKKGTLVRSKSSSEYPLLRGALGQLLTIEDLTLEDKLAIAVPASEKFNELAAQWRRAPLISKIPIKILTIDRERGVAGWD